MIKLEIEPYCHNCPYFEAETHKIFSDNKVVCTEIICSDELRCRLIIEHLKNQQREGKQ